MKKIIIIAGLFAVFVSRVFAGGPVAIEWNNDGTGSSGIGQLFADQAGLIPLSAGVDTVAGDGFLLQLIALQGGTNYVLVSATIGDAPGAAGYDGFFNISSAVSSQTLAGAIGSPLGIRFFNGPTVELATHFGIVSNLTILSPTPNWSGAPPFPLVFGVDVDVPAFQGARTLNGLGFYTDTLIPEPSTFFLVGLGGVLAWYVRKRKR